MSVKAIVVFWRDGKEICASRPFEFVQLPSAGYKLTVRLEGDLSSPEGFEDIYEVQKVEHIPATRDGETPVARLLCEFVTGRSG